VNVRFVPTPAKVLSEASPRVVTFVGGKERTGNYLEAHVRTGGGRNRDMFMGLAGQMSKIWAENVGYISLCCFTLIFLLFFFFKLPFLL